MANQEHLEILKQGVEVWNAWRKKHSEELPDLSGTDLSRANLSFAELGFTNLIFTCLNGTDLSGARVGSTTFGNLDLRAVKGLKTVEHKGPSTIGIDTIYRS